ncbi:MULTISPECIES: LysR family transcriptional regulator [unclassified Achromobacter]|uniref:LysR family transcriptional regulator n=1 Tax=unclassified Achromobacter TaxID=2626865 RepID=UPI000B517466|nr:MULTISPECIES: LysR family transcriptional regulator [unclassified Achromobacter]OWT70237.1 LysR family transcriptional regulator [Achromobacter sp. HZ34]OWT71777.1 LysR family transcriptional regulator [Achromobacter sp. HZ28]
MRFSLRQMEVFRAVMLTGSIKGASKLLFTSQPALSRIVAHTENTLGLALFRRVKGKLVPTVEAEALYREVNHCYEHVLRIDEFARGLASGQSGTLNLACSPALSRGVVAATITAFVREYPNIQVNFVQILLNGMAQEVLSKKVDLAISVLPIEHPNLRVETFLEGRMVCVVPRGHALARKRRVSLADLGGHPLIAHHPNIPFGQLVASAFDKAGVAMRVSVHIHQTDMACSLVRAGAGVAVVDEFTMAGMAWPDVQVLPLAEDILLYPSVVRSVFDTGRSHADKFIELLRKTTAGDLKSVT